MTMFDKQRQEQQMQNRYNSGSLKEGSLHNNDVLKINFLRVFSQEAMA